MPVERGFFVDWDGMTRRTEAPGDWYRCEVHRESNHVDVIQPDGCVIYEADFFVTVDQLQAAGVNVRFAE